MVRVLRRDICGVVRENLNMVKFWCPSKTILHFRNCFILLRVTVDLESMPGKRLVLFKKYDQYLYELL